MESKVRRWAVGTAMVLAGPVMLASYVLWPSMLVDGAQFVEETIAYGRARTTWSLILGALYFAVAVVAVMGLVHLLRDRRTVASSVGGGAAIVGLVLNGAAIGIAVAFLEIALADMSMAQKVALLDATMASGSIVVLYAGPLLLSVGTVVLGTALYRARTVPKTSAVLFGVYGPMLLVGYGAAIISVVIAGFAALAVALIPIGIAVLTETEAEWEHPPVFHGFTPGHASP